MNYNEFKGETLYIFTSVTGPYKEFFNAFLSSTINFFPENKKVINIWSDGLDQFNGIELPNKNIDMINVHHIIDLPYPLVPMQKTYIQKNYIEDYMNYVFYFDIDTIFLECADKTWEFLFNKIEDGNIVMSKHPHYDAHPEYIWNLIEENKDSKAYIPDNEYERAISSFWCGKREEVLKLCDYVNAMFKYDLKNLRYLPKFVDENYINKVSWMCHTNEISDLKFYNTEHFITIPDYYYSVDCNNIFLKQKYDNTIKNSKKYVN